MGEVSNHPRRGPVWNAWTVAAALLTGRSEAKRDEIDGRLLERAGLREVFNVAGREKAWKTAGSEVVHRQVALSRTPPFWGRKRRRPTPR